MIVFLDTGVLGLISSPSNTGEAKECEELRAKSAIKEATQLWAEARRQGISTADIKNIDADIIIASQWKLLKDEYPGQYIVIATTNVKHLQRFTEAQEWKNINL